MSNRPFVIFGAFAAVVAVIVYMAFIREGSESAAVVPVDSADEEAQQMFDVNCGNCHTLAAAGTDGVVGPNLDEILPIAGAPTGTAEEIADANLSAYEGVYGRVLNAVENGVNGSTTPGRMPGGIVNEEQAEEVSAFVAATAGEG